MSLPQRNSLEELYLPPQCFLDIYEASDRNMWIDCARLRFIYGNIPLIIVVIVICLVMYYFKVSGWYYLIILSITLLVIGSSYLTVLEAGNQFDIIQVQFDAYIKQFSPPGDIGTQRRAFRNYIMQQQKIGAMSYRQNQPGIGLGVAEGVLIGEAISRPTVVVEERGGREWRR